jgi:hypothetical protein
VAEKIQVWPEGHNETGDTITAGVTIETPGQEPRRLWYRLPNTYRQALTTVCDPFVLGTIFLAMSRASDVVVHGQVSPSLLHNLEEFQATWACWRPKRYTKIDVVADLEQEPPPPASPRAAVAAFSGGADSCFTVWRHHTGQSGRLRRQIKVGVMVHGFDIELGQTKVFERAAAKSAKMLASLDLALIPVVTNFREVVANWEDSHGSGLASCLALFQAGYGAGLVGSTDSYDQLVLPWGSNPITDRMLSSRTFAIVHDGAAFSRSQKIRTIAAWPEAIRYLRVCWEGDAGDRNCGRCEKCIRTMLNFRVMGLELPACFERDIEDHDILRLANLRPETPAFAYLEEILSAAKTTHSSESWVGALERCLARNRRAASAGITLRQRARKTRFYRKSLPVYRWVRRQIGLPLGAKAQH